MNWIGLLFTTTGIVLNANHFIACWPVWLFGNMFWIIYFAKKKDWAPLVVNIILQLSNIYGWILWANS